MQPVHPLVRAHVIPFFLAVLACSCAHEASPASRHASATLTSPGAAEGASLTAAGRRWTQAFYQGHIEEMYAEMGPGLRDSFGGSDALAAFRTQVVRDLGAEVAVVSERTEVVDGLPRYVRIARFERLSVDVRVSLALGDDGRIVYFLVKPEGHATREAKTDKLDYVTRTSLHLPFEGAWTVAWGGRTLAENHHASTRDQRFAYDFVVTKDGATHTGDGRHNVDYFAYGRNVLAPAAGRIVAATDGLPENVPGQMDATHPFGNYVVVDHGSGELSVLAHLQPGSVTVHVGDVVETGRVLGKCGNSGHSSEPHLHYHLQDTATLLEGNGLPAPFVGYVADGKPVARGEATRGQLIERARSSEGS